MYLLKQTAELFLTSMLLAANYIWPTIHVIAFINILPIYLFHVANTSWQTETDVISKQNYYKHREDACYTHTPDFSWV